MLWTKKCSLQCQKWTIHNRIYINVPWYNTSPKIPHSFQDTHRYIVNLWRFCPHSIIRFWHHAKLATGRQMTIWALKQNGWIYIYHGWSQAILHFAVSVPIANPLQEISNKDISYFRPHHPLYSLHQQWRFLSSLTIICLHRVAVEPAGSEYCSSTDRLDSLTHSLNQQKI